MSADDRPSDEIDTVAYAVSFCQAAERLADTDWNDNHPLVGGSPDFPGPAKPSGNKGSLT
jgi:hypothetical protein